MVSCKKGPTRHAYALQIGPFLQDTLDLWLSLLSVFPDCLPSMFSMFSSLLLLSYDGMLHGTLGNSAWNLVGVMLLLWITSLGTNHLTLCSQNFLNIMASGEPVWKTSIFTLKIVYVISWHGTLSALLTLCEEIQMLLVESSYKWPLMLTLGVIYDFSWNKLLNKQ